MAKKVVPVGLKDAGRQLWDETLTVYKLAEHEQAVLAQACHTLDLVNAMRNRVARDGIMSTGSMGQDVVNPLIGEMRQQRQLLSSLLKALNLPDVDPAAVSGGLRVVPDENQQRAAVTSRWKKAYGAQVAGG